MGVTTINARINYLGN